ncbi:MAG: Biotin carboxyl carrier protein of acetyl-CoA carboxylase [Candidatus Anoxychlamydiales bacterium]|nr:Biotin carboxyl carrier protein of acetyl-CoA carboxylase [Candidatus Anoxychlamydiales bacterium]
MQLDHIKKLIKLLEESELKKIHLKEGDFEIELEKESKHVAKHVTYEKPTEKPHHHHQNIESKVEKDNAKYIESPMVGTFYSSPSPDQASFVKIGDFVKKDTIVCIIEAMKVMNEVKANVEGKIVEILIDNAQPVEFSTKLFRVE